MKQMRRGNLIFDCQFGSTGKGLIAGYLAERDQPDVVVTAWAANAGHTYIDRAGRKFVHTMLANGVVSPRLRAVLIGPGSMIDPAALRRELDACADLMQGVSVLIHPHAAVIEERHREEEEGPMTKIGSTKKGCGAAAIHRIRRNPDDYNTAAQPRGTVHPLLIEHGLGLSVVGVEDYQAVLESAECLQVEGAQGYSLSMYHGFYPYTTSRDVSVHQTLADCGIPPHIARWLTIVGTLRTFPIRVANRYDEQGNMVGWSGPCYADQKETTFEAIGQATELTTVTKLPRRVFTFSMQQMYQAAWQNGVQDLFLNFCNYMDPGPLSDLLADIEQRLHSSGKPTRVRYLGYGPTAADIHELGTGVAR